MTLATIPWQLTFCAGYIVPPCKGCEDVEIAEQVKGSQIELDGEVIRYFRPSFVSSVEECSLEVAFAPAEDGSQNNPVRQEIRVAALGTPENKLSAARRLAERLASVTDHRSNPGLLVILTGEANGRHRVVIWKFPADETFQATFLESNLTIQVIEDAFSRKGSYFKAAVFEDTPAETGFLEGLVEDKQAKSRASGVSQYWVVNFLDARFALTGAQGTKLLARALRETINNANDVDLQQQLLAAAVTIKSQARRPMSLFDFAEDYLPEESRETFLRGFDEIMIYEMFVIDPLEIDKQLHVRSLSLTNGVKITAPFDDFDETVQIEYFDDQQVEVTINSQIHSETVKTR